MLEQRAEHTDNVTLIIQLLKPSDSTKLNQEITTQLNNIKRRFRILSLGNTALKHFNSRAVNIRGCCPNFSQTL